MSFENPTKKLEGAERETFLTGAGKEAHYNFLDQNNKKGEGDLGYVPRLRPVKDASFETTRADKITDWESRGMVTRDADGKIEKIDIANIPYDELPKPWQESNISSVNAVLGAIEAGTTDTDKIASSVHNSWKASNGEYGLGKAKDLIDPAKFATLHPKEDLDVYIKIENSMSQFGADEGSYDILKDEEQQKDHDFINKTKELYEKMLNFAN